MIKIRIDQYGEVYNIDDFSLINIAINKEEYFSKFVYSLYNEEVSNFLHIYYNEKEIDISDLCVKHFDFLNLNLNEKDNISSLYKIFKKLSYEDLGEDIDDLVNKSNEIIRKLSFNFDFEITTNSKISIEDLLKLFKVSIAEKEQITLIENVINYFKIVSRIQNKYIFLTLFLNQYFNEKEIEVLCYELSLLNIKIINFERFFKRKNKEYEKTFMIDDDLILLE